jgi:pimeloyl-ACP methyl ester carboxylesterase
VRLAIRLVLVLAMLSTGLVGASPAAAQTPVVTPTAVPGACQRGTLSTGALSMFCVPSSGWNGDLIVFAHGYVGFNKPLDFYHLTFGGVYVPDLVQSVGFAFATTSYRQNGLAVVEGADDIRALVRAFPSAAQRTPLHTYLVGFSEGGLVTTLLIEQSPEMFSGGLAGCGPIGDFRQHVKYLGDFRVLFDVFFPRLLPPSPVSIPAQVIADWDSVYVPRITSAMSANPGAASQLIRPARAAIDPASPGPTTLATTLRVLWYNVFGTNDATAKLGGGPYDNRQRFYFGSRDDLLLNLVAQRFGASPTAVARMAPYQTSGRLTRPLVTLHTTQDELVPFWHELLYDAKVRAAGRGGQLVSLPVFRYGHCNFTINELLAAFGLLVAQVTGAQPAGLVQRLDRAQAIRDFDRARQAASAGDRR